MKPALIGRRPCGCVERFQHYFEKAAALMLAEGLKVESVEMEAGAIAASTGPACPHGSTQQQLAALVKKQKGEIERLEALVEKWRAAFQEEIQCSKNP